MDLFNKEQLQELAATETEPCVSIYMPAFRFESDVSQNKIRFKNLIHEAEKQLKDAGHREPDAAELLAPAAELLDDENYWRHQSDGLAVFVSSDTVRAFRLPLHFDELVTVASRFHVKPLFPILATNNRFYLLALSQNNVQLFQGTHYAISEIEVEDLPDNLEEALFLDDEEQTIQEHTGARAGGRHDAVRHGQGAGTDDKRARPKDQIKRFFREVDAVVKRALADEQAPLVLAGVDYYLPIYSDVNGYNHLIEDAIVSGNPDHQHPKELHEQAWSIVEPHFMEAQSDSVDGFRQIMGNGSDGLASDDLHEIVPAAFFSRIDTLFVPIGEHLWGRYDQAANAVELHDEHESGDDDLLDLAAVHTYLNGGTVHALRRENMPVDKPLAATFRFKTDVAAAEQ